MEECTGERVVDMEDEEEAEKEVRETESKALVELIVERREERRRRVTEEDEEVGAVSVVGVEAL